MILSPSFKNILQMLLHFLLQGFSCYSECNWEGRFWETRNNRTNQGGRGVSSLVFSYF